MSNETINLAQGIQIERPLHEDGRVELVESKTLHFWPVGTFVENLAIADGFIYVSVESLGEVHKIDSQGNAEIFASFGSSVTGLAVVGGDLLVNTGSIGTPGWHIARVAMSGEQGASVSIEDALFLNGSSILDQERLLVPDSILGRIYQVNLSTGEVSIWLEDDLLKKVSSEPMLPGVNGLRVSGDKAYFTNTDRAVFGFIDIDSAGTAQKPEILAERLVGDDFAIASDGSIFVTNHVYNTVMRLTPDGERITVAGPEQGMAGCTSAVFGKSENDRFALYVTTTGGILSPYEGQVREAKLIRLDVGIGTAIVGWTGATNA